MDGNNLINFSNDSYPLMPLPEIPQEKCNSRLSDLNPFDNVFRKSMQQKDSLEIVLEKSVQTNLIEDKENVPHLISPLMTPRINKKKQLTISNTPIYITNKISESPTALKKEYDALTKLNKSDIHNNSSLQFLSESVLNDTSHEFLNQAVLSFDSNKSSYIDTSRIPEVFVNDVNSFKTEGKIDNYENTRIRSVSSNISDFSNELDSLQISCIPSSSTATDSKLLSTFDKAFVTNSLNSNLQSSDYEEIKDFRRRCMSASRPKKPDFNYNFPSRKTLNNSFSGFCIDDRIENDFKELDEFLDKHDPVLFDIKKMNNKGDASIVQQALEAEDLIDCTLPPWIQQDVSFPDDESDTEQKPDINPDINKQDTNEINNPVQTIPQEQLEDKIPPTKEEEIADESILNEDSFEINANKKDTHDKYIEVEKAKNVLQNISHLLNCGDESSDRKKLCECLNTLARTLNLDDSVKKQSKPIIKKSDKSKEESKSKPVKSKLSYIKNIESKIKIQCKLTADKIKVKHDKESNSKGPLKAVIPVKNMAKTKRSFSSKFSLGNSICTPTKTIPIHKTSTPNEPKFKNPPASSTPILPRPTTPTFGSRPSTNGLTTPTSTKQANLATTPTRTSQLSIRTLQRPSSTNDLNRSISPKNIPTLESLKVSSQNLTNNTSVNRSIPTPGNFSLLRRKSASDLKENNNLHKSLDNGKTTKPTKLKRSTSFQNKYLKI